MRVLIAIGVPKTKEAGAAAVVLHHGEELGKRGHDVDCWFLEDVLARPARWKRFEGLQFAASLARRVLRDRSKYDVVNIHAPWGCVYGMWRRLVRPAGAPPYVMTMHGSEGRYVEAMGDEHRKGRTSNFGWKNRAWHRVYHQRMFEGSIKTADYGVVVSQEGRLYAERMSGGGGERFRFLPNGVEESFFTTRDYDSGDGSRLLYVGTWLDRKGVFYLAEAFRILAGRVRGIRLTVAGCLMNEERVKEFFGPEVRAQVDVKAFVASEDMPAVYAGHDIFVLPSLMEGMPLSLLEAMASGMAIVTTATGGMADMIEDGTNGLLVPPGNAESLAGAMERLVRSTELRREMGRAAQGKVRSQTWEQMTGKLEEVLALAAASEKLGQRAVTEAEVRHQHQGESS